jgi:hypothetical protein
VVDERLACSADPGLILAEVAGQQSFGCLNRFRLRHFREQMPEISIGLILDDIEEKAFHQYGERYGHADLSDRRALERLLAMLH